MGWGPQTRTKWEVIGVRCFCAVSEADARCCQTTRPGSEARWGKAAGQDQTHLHHYYLPPTFSIDNKEEIPTFLNFAWLTIGVPYLLRPAGATLATEKEICCQKILGWAKARVEGTWGRTGLMRDHGSSLLHTGQLPSIYCPFLWSNMPFLICNKSASMGCFTRGTRRWQKNIFKIILQNSFSFQKSISPVKY